MSPDVARANVVGPTSTRVGRRTVLGAVVLTGTVAAVPAVVQLLPDRVEGPDRAPARAELEAHVGARFSASTVDADGRAAERHGVTLTRVVDLDTTGDRADHFAAHFEALDDLGQGTYRLSRTGFSEADVFLVAGRASGRTSLTAVFDRRPVPGARA